MLDKSKNMTTLELVKSSVTENEYSGFYFIENPKKGTKRVYDAREKAESIAKAIDEPALGFVATPIEPTWEANRMASLMEDGATKEEAESDFHIQQQRKVDALGQKLLERTKVKGDLDY